MSGISGKQKLSLVVAKMAMVISLFALSPMGHAKGDQFKNFDLVNAGRLKSLYKGDIGISPVDFQENNPLYQKILTELGNQYEHIGERQANNVLAQRDGLYLGGLNNVGFRWGSEFG